MVVKQLHPVQQFEATTSHRMLKVVLPDDQPVFSAAKYTNAMGGTLVYVPRNAADY